MRKLFPWLRSHPFISIFGGFLALLVAAHFFLNWRAERRWQAYVREGRARGVKFDLTEFAPPKIPDEENFAALPLMRAISLHDGKTPMAFPLGDRPQFIGSVNGEAISWEKWQTYFKTVDFISETTDSPPRDALRALNHYAQEIQEWSEWKNRPSCRIPLAHKDDGSIQLPNLTLFVNAARLFELQAQAYLALGDSDAAYGSFQNGFQAYRALKSQPTLIAALFRILVLKTLTRTVGQGLANHQWPTSTLAKIDAEFAAIRTWDDYQFSLETERGFVNEEMDRTASLTPWQRSREIGDETKYLPGTEPINSAAATLISKGQVRDNQLRQNRHIDELLARVDRSGTQFDPDGPTPSDENHLSELEGRWFCLFKDSARIFSRLGAMFCASETQVRQVRLAIAIERFRSARDSNLETLTELVPEFIAALPGDIYGGKPMIYRRKESGGFLLYSVGSNRIDDGGATGGKGSEQNQLDWVWPYSRD